MGSASLELFPNPSNGFTKLKMKKDAISTIEIMSLSGQLVQFPTEFSKANTQVKINTSNFASGVYMLIIQGESGMIYSKKLMVK